MTKIAARMFGMAAASGLAGAFTFGALAAEDWPKLHFQIVGIASDNFQSKAVEFPWAATFSKDTGGRITAEILPADTVGIGGPETLRLMQIGALTFSRGVISNHGGDNPRFDSLDLPGLTPTLQDLRKAIDSYMPVLVPILEKQWGVKLLRISPNPPQVYWCNAPLKGLAELKGLKVRVFNKGMSAFVEGAGGTPVAMPSQDVVPALQRRAIDCAITGSANGNSGKWPEVTTHLLPLYMGWANQYWGASKSAWERIEPKVQAFLEKKFKELDEAVWRNAADTGQQGIDCSVGRDPCTIAGLTKYKMTLVPISDGDKKQAQKIVEDNVLKGWAQRCGAACVTEWNDTVGKALGVQVPLPR